MLTVSLIDSGCTISLEAVGSVLTTGCTVALGMESFFNATSAQAGSFTFLVCLGAKDSLPPNPFEDIGLPETCGVNTAVMAFDCTRYWRATRLTSATVTF